MSNANLRDILSLIISESSKVNFTHFLNEDNCFSGELLFDADYNSNKLDSELKEIQAQMQGHGYEYTIVKETKITIKTSKQI